MLATYNAQLRRIVCMIRACCIYVFTVYLQHIEHIVKTKCSPSAMYRVWLFLYVWNYVDTHTCTTAKLKMLFIVSRASMLIKIKRFSQSQFGYLAELTRYTPEICRAPKDIETKNHKPPEIRCCCCNSASWLTRQTAVKIYKFTMTVCACSK